MQWETLGDLTTLGMRQLYDVGVLLRKRYIDTKLMSGTYDPTQVFVRSSDKTRCLMSAISLHTGMYPSSDEQINFSNDIRALPAKYQTIPIEDAPLNRELVIRGYSTWFASSLFSLTILTVYYIYFPF